MLEEEVLDTHKMVMDHTTRFLDGARNVFSTTHEVDYDQEGKTAFPRLFQLTPNPCIRACLRSPGRVRAHTLANARTHAFTYACTHA